MLLGKRCLQDLNCRGLSSYSQYNCRITGQILTAAQQKLGSRTTASAASDETGLRSCGNSRSSHTTTTTSSNGNGNGVSSQQLAAAAGGNNSNKQQQQQQQQQQQRLSADQVLHQAARPSQQQVHPHRTQHQPEHRQLHPQAALQMASMQQFELVSEKAVHQRYLSVYDRRIRFHAHDNPAESRVVDFDVVGHPRSNFCFAVTFPFHPYTDGRKGGEVTLIREYAQGPNALAYCLPTGGLDPQRHADLQDCAARELSEEAWLAGGEWHRLLPADHPGMPEVKWCMNRFVPFLVVNPQPDLNPGSRDAEEASMEVLRVPLDEFRQLMLSGEMLLPSITTAYMALDKLKDQGLL